MRLTPINLVDPLVGKVYRSARIVLQCPPPTAAWTSLAICTSRWRPSRTPPSPSWLLRAICPCFRMVSAKRAMCANTPCSTITSRYAYASSCSVADRVYLVVVQKAYSIAHVTWGWHIDSRWRMILRTCKCLSHSPPVPRISSPEWIRTIDRPLITIPGPPTGSTRVSLCFFLPNFTQRAPCLVSS